MTGRRHTAGGILHWAARHALPRQVGGVARWLRPSCLPAVHGHVAGAGSRGQYTQQGNWLSSVVSCAAMQCNWQCSILIAE